MKSHRRPLSNIGTSMLLVIFISMALATFAALNLSTSKTNYNYVKRISDKQTSYNQANNKAQDIANKILEKLILIEKETSNDTYLDTVRDSLENFTYKNIMVQLSQSKNDLHICYKVPINDNSYLYISLKINDLNNNNYYNIENWNEIVK